jgi:ADP-glucose pyrophosphorylase
MERQAIPGEGRGKAMARDRILAMILAGGKGERLEPLTRDRSKPAVPFGSRYRIVDFVLSNFVNSGILSVYVLASARPSGTRSAGETCG